MSRILTIGTKGGDVAAWQQFLSEQGFNPGPVDGDFELGTQQATIQFQRREGLGDDGVVGPNTYAAAGKFSFAIPEDVPPMGDGALDHIGDSTIFQTADGRVIYYTAGMEIDADGAFRAYKDGNDGLDYDQNGKDQNGNWVGVLTDGNGKPIEQKDGDPAPGYYISTTSLQDLTRPKTDPRRYVDAESIPYIVLPGGHLGNASLGDYAIVINTRTGKRIAAIVADAGPKHKIGEASIATARELLGNDHCSPRNGGTEKAYIRYIVFPNSRDGVFPASFEGISGRTEKLLAGLEPETVQSLAIA